MAVVHVKSRAFFQKKLKANNKLSATVHINPEDGKTAQENEEYEVAECTISPAKIICPDCGGITLEGLDYCNKCGGELNPEE